MKRIFALLFVLNLATCATYNAHVAERSDSLSGYAKDDGAQRGAGVAYTHRVIYR